MGTHDNHPANLIAPVTQLIMQTLLALDGKGIIHYLHSNFIAYRLAIMSEDEKAAFEASEHQVGLQVRFAMYGEAPADLKPLLSTTSFEEELAVWVTTDMQMLLHPPISENEDEPLDTPTLDKLYAMVMPFVKGLEDMAEQGIAMYMYAHPAKLHPGSVDVSGVKSITELLTQIWIRIPSNGHWICAIPVPIPKNLANEGSAKPDDAVVH
jgi:hypothetical protein